MLASFSESLEHFAAVVKTRRLERFLPAVADTAIVASVVFIIVVARGVWM